LIKENNNVFVFLNKFENSNNVTAEIIDTRKFQKESDSLIGLMRKLIIKKKDVRI
jgi:hypothetical protein